MNLVVATRCREMMTSMETAPTENALLGGRVRLLQPSRGYRVAVDAVLLAAAIVKTFLMKPAGTLASAVFVSRKIYVNLN